MSPMVLCSYTTVAPGEPTPEGTPGSRSEPTPKGAPGSRRQPAPMRVDVMTKLRAVANERRTRIHECFQDYDGLRKGICTFSHLKTALTLVSIDLEASELE